MLASIVIIFVVASQAAESDLPHVQQPEQQTLQIESPWNRIARKLQDHYPRFKKFGLISMTSQVIGCAVIALVENLVDPSCNTFGFNDGTSGISHTWTISGSMTGPISKPVAWILWAMSTGLFLVPARIEETKTICAIAQKKNLPCRVRLLQACDLLTFAASGFFFGSLLYYDFKCCRDWNMFFAIYYFIAVVIEQIFKFSVQFSLRNIVEIKADSAIWKSLAALVFLIVAIMPFGYTDSEVWLRWLRNINDDHRQWLFSIIEFLFAFANISAQRSGLGLFKKLQEQQQRLLNVESEERIAEP